MKYFWLPAAALSLLLALSLWNAAAVRDAVDPWCAALARAREAASDEAWEDAERLFRDTERAWGKKSGFYHTAIEHDELDDAEELFARAGAALEARDAAAFAGELDALIVQLRIIAEMQGLSLENIL